MDKDDLKTVLRDLHRETCRQKPRGDAIHGQLLRLRATAEPEDGYAERKLRKIVNECDFIATEPDDLESRIMALRGDVELLLNSMDK